MAVASVGLAAGPAAADEPPIVQVGTVVGQKPDAGWYHARYRNFAGEYCVGMHCGTATYFDVVHGDVATKLTAYRVRDGLKRFDFYFVTVESQLTHFGASDSGDMRIEVADLDVLNQVDYADSPTMVAAASSCRTVQFSLGYSFGPIGASTDLGAARFCSGSARDDLSHAGATAVYAVSPLAKVQSLFTTRLEKVRAGTHPTFRVRVTVPTDRCTSTFHLTTGTVCHTFDNRTTRHTYWVHTNGS